MAISVTSAERSPDGMVIVTGSEFTKTTTLIYVDDVVQDFTFVSATEIELSGVAQDAIEVRADKNGVSTAVDITDVAQQEAPAVTDPTPPAVPADTPEVTAIAPGTWPSPIDTFRTQVQGTALVGLVPTGDEKTPYPTGTPWAAGSKFWMRNGYYKSATPT